VSLETNLLCKRATAQGVASYFQVLYESGELLIAAGHRMVEEMMPKRFLLQQRSQLLKTRLLCITDCEGCANVLKLAEYMNDDEQRERDWILTLPAR
jgi:hypothetical protein